MQQEWRKKYLKLSSKALCQVSGAELAHVMDTSDRSLKVFLCKHGFGFSNLSPSATLHFKSEVELSVCSAVMVCSENKTLNKLNFGFACLPYSCLFILCHFDFSILAKGSNIVSVDQFLY